MENNSDIYKAQADIADQGVKSTDYDPNIIDKKEKHEEFNKNNYTDMPNEPIFSEKKTQSDINKEFHNGPYVASFSGPNNTEKSDYQAVHYA